MHTHENLTEPDLRNRMAMVVLLQWRSRAKDLRVEGRKYDSWIRGFVMGYWLAMMEIQEARRLVRRAKRLSERRRAVRSTELDGWQR